MEYLDTANRRVLHFTIPNMFSNCRRRVVLQWTRLNFARDSTLSDLFAPTIFLDGRPGKERSQSEELYWSIPLRRISHRYPRSLQNVFHALRGFYVSHFKGNAAVWSILRKLACSNRQQPTVHLTWPNKIGVIRRSGLEKFCFHVSAASYRSTSDRLQQMTFLTRLPCWKS